MSLEIKIFGQLKDVFKEEKIIVEALNNTDDLLFFLQKKYPQLAHKTFAIAVDRKIIKANTGLKTNSEIALLPPFSGG
jgi:molybdopterin synthase sulfur carrier subunit